MRTRKRKSNPYNNPLTLEHKAFYLAAKLLSEDLEHKFPPEDGLDFQGVYEGTAGAKVRWQFADKPEGFHSESGVNFLQRAGVMFKEVCYGVTTITSPDDREAILLIGTDWWTTAWLNGQPVVSARDPKFVAEDGAPFMGWRPLPARVQLKKGANTLLVKCHGGSSYEWFTCFVSDPGDLTFSAKPPK